MNTGLAPREHACPRRGTPYTAAAASKAEHAQCQQMQRMKPVCMAVPLLVDKVSNRSRSSSTTCHPHRVGASVPKISVSASPAQRLGGLVAQIVNGQQGLVAVVPEQTNQGAPRADDGCGLATDHEPDLLWFAEVMARRQRSYTRIQQVMKPAHQRACSMMAVPPPCN